LTLGRKSFPTSLSVTEGGDLSQLEQNIVKIFLTEGEKFIIKNSQ